MRQNKHRAFLERNASTVTSFVIFVAMMAVLLPSAIVSYQAVNDYQAREFAAKRASVPALTFEQLQERVSTFQAQGERIAVPDYEAYFAFLAESELLKRAIEVREAESGDYRSRILYLRIGSIESGVVNSFMPSLHNSPEFVEIVSSSAFREAQKAAGQSLTTATVLQPALSAYAASAVMKGWSMALLACAPFALLGVALQLRRLTGDPWIAIGMTFLSDWRPWAATASLPLWFLATPLLYADRETLKVNLRYLAYVLSSVLSIFAGGGIVKAQSSDAGAGKKKSSWKVSLVERIEADTAGASSTTIVDVDHVPTGTTLEGIVATGDGFTRTYLLGIKRFASFRRGTTSGSLSGIAGIETFTSRPGDTTVYAVTGARASLSHRRFSLNVPFASLEQPVAGKPAKTTSALIVRPGIRFTKRFSVVGEQFARFTAERKTKLTTGVFARFRLRKSLDLETGPYVTNGGARGFRFQLAFSQ